MSAAGKYAHQQRTKRHAQRTSGIAHHRQAETVETATWLTDSMACSRGLARSTDNGWTIAEFAAYAALTYEEAERRLRYMSKLGFLQMGKRVKDGEFVCFIFSMVNPNLPK